MMSLHSDPGCSLGIGDLFTTQNSTANAQRPKTIFYSDTELLLKYSPVMLHISAATRILNENPVTKSHLPTLLHLWLPYHIIGDVKEQKHCCSEREGKIYPGVVVYLSLRERKCYGSTVLGVMLLH